MLFSNLECSMMRWLASVVVLMTLSGCDSSDAPPQPKIEANRSGVVTLQRDVESEELISQTGQSVWVFRHSGGPLTTRFVIYHRPAGKGQKESVIFEGSGDDLLASVSLKSPDEFQSGFIVIHRPDRLGLGRSVINSLSSGSIYVRQEETSRIVFPESILKSKAYSGMQEVSENSVDIAAGTSKTILDDFCIYNDRENDPDRPVAERESLHYVLTVTALAQDQTSTDSAK